MTQAPPIDSLLKGVSRSFYLSVRLLPAGLQAPVGLAYLLARATDTVADTATVEADRRLSLLGLLGRSIQAGRVAAGLQATLDEFAQTQVNPEEGKLLARGSDCIAAMHDLADADRADVQTVLRHIVHGQSLDVERFPSAATVQALPDAAALEEYTYLVAGCVGEFWTEVCSRHVAGFARLPHGRMRQLGRSFGTGLQLVNIVRDAGEDLAAGRCYLPADALTAAGVDLAAIAGETERFAIVWRRWQEVARERLADGIRYADAVESRRIRAAVALPALLGARTLSLLREAGPAALSTRVKVPRDEVRRLLLRMGLTLAGRGALRAEWENRAR